jgi:hypothetical protein
MKHRIGWGFDHATKEQRAQTAERLVQDTLDRMKQPLTVAVVSFFEAPISPTTLMALELAFVGLVREIGRLLLQSVLNACEPDSPDLLPRDLRYQCGGYRRRKQKTANRSIASRFGKIVLHRRGYRSWQSGDESIFPLEMFLGLNNSATPALVDWIGRRVAEAGATQKTAIALLRTECGVRMGVKRLRACVEQLSESMAELRQTHQVDALLLALATALKSSGARKPVLSVGRDGVTLRQYEDGRFEVATAGTLSVYDRRGKRLQTIYLAWPPELGQATMDGMLTDLLVELFDRYQGPLPRLAYVTDSGSNETGYYKRVLCRMVHPRTQKRLEWIRVADFYHASERIWAMSEVLFGKGTRKANGWAKRMLKSLKKPSGPSRVLHSAATHFARRNDKLSKKKREAFAKAYRYIQSRTQYMRYNEYASVHIPLGSGVTEAACKTVFTQRLKNSGMRWTHVGAKTILNLRVILLSKTWSPTYAAHLSRSYPAELAPYNRNSNNKARNAA